jgi:hypothetical protein
MSMKGDLFSQNTLPLSDTEIVSVSEKSAMRMSKSGEDVSSCFSVLAGNLGDVKVS